MQVDEHLDELPEAVPLHRVAPLWRLLAVLAAIAAVALLFVVLILCIVMVNLQNRAPIVRVVPPSPAVVAPRMAPGGPMAGIGGPGGDDEASAESQNLPYPVRADLAEGDPEESAAENRPPPAKPAPTARERFLDKGTDIWKLKRHLPDQVAISADGVQLAYVVDGNLTAGPIGSQRQIVGTVMQSVPVATMPGRAKTRYPTAMVAMPEAGIRLLGRPSWSPDDRFLYCADNGGHLRRFDLQNGRPDGLADAQVLPFDGEWPAPIPTEPENLVFVRAQPRPKLDLAGKRPILDLLEVVIGDLGTQEVRVVLPASTSVWRHLAVSPDGKRLALVSDRGHEGQQSRHLRVFVVDLAGGEPKPLSPPATQAGPICWAADGQALIYARSQEPAPADHWEDELAGPNRALDLYEYSFDTNRETRLSRGGGCFSPSANSNGELFYLAVQGSDPELLLRRVPLSTAREFAAQEPSGRVRDVAAWGRLLNDVLEEAKIPAKVEGATLTPELCGKLAETFHQLYRKHFQAEPPSTLKGLGRQRRELRQLNLSPSLRPALTLILGALEGEHLVRRHGARWHLTKGPVVPGEDSAPERTPETPFGYVANPFALVNNWARQSTQSNSRDRDVNAGDDPLISLLRRAEGRTLVLTNDAAAARAVLAELADPDFGRATELLQGGKAEAAEQVFQGLLKQKRHERNLHLALEIGRLLYEQKRLGALQQLLEEGDRLPQDARKFNLLGLALIDAQPQQAVEAFKNALRCDLRFEPAYLNLAQAYQMANDLPSARMCLQRYLALMPGGAFAADARRRLAAVDTTGK